MTGRLEGRHAFITGGASGLGAACAELFASEGAAVAVADLAPTEQASRATIDRITGAGGSAHFVSCDVTSRVDVVRAVAEAEAEAGAINCVVTSAGVATHPDHSFDTPLVSIESEHWHHVMDVNVLGTLHAAQVCCAAMMSEGTTGSVITLASFAAKRPTRGVYSISKAAVWMLTRTLAVELAPHGIRVNAIAPGVIDTPMLDDASGGGVEAWKSAQADRVPLGRLGAPLDVARVAGFLASDDSSYLTGTMLAPDGGLANTFAGG